MGPPGGPYLNPLTNRYDLADSAAGHRLAALDGAISAGKVSAALRSYVSSPEYQRRLVHGAWRVDLNGNPVGIVSQEDEAHARAQLAGIEAKRAECVSASTPALNLAERQTRSWRRIWLPL